MDFLGRLSDPRPLIGVELRPPRRTVSAQQGLESWIDTNHAVRRLLEQDTLVFLTDSAVGQHEEESLLHLLANLGADADVSRIAPILTLKHKLDYCTRFPQRAFDQGHRALVVLGGDRHDNVPRCVDHAYILRQIIRARQPTLSLGGWVNPHGDPAQQVEYIMAAENTTDFYLTQVVSHYDLQPVDALLEAGTRQGLKLPGMFGVFYYRSARPATFRHLEPFFPVPAVELQRDLGPDGPGPVEVTARSIAALRARGVSRVYVSNLPLSRAGDLLERITARVDELVAGDAAQA